jgi:hypothetical protein
MKINLKLYKIKVKDLELSGLSSIKYGKIFLEWVVPY